MEKKEEYLNILSEVMKDAPVSHYCFGGEMDGAVCLTEEHDLWTVFTLERGQRYDSLTFPNLVDAGIALIQRVFMLDEPDEHVNRFVSSIVR